MTLIGPADEFWRVRIVRVDDTDELDLDWRDDVLYRAPDSRPADDVTVWRVEAVRLDTEVACTLGTFGDEVSARAVLDEAAEDLRELTVSRFAERYGCPA